MKWTWLSLPSRALVAAFSQPAEIVGGDYFDFFRFRDHTFGVAIADVMGKGVPAALFAASLRTLVRSMVEWTHDPGELLSRVNRLMYPELSQVDMFITAQIALLDAHERTLRVAGAGHCPLLLTSSGNPKPRRIGSQGMPIGIVQDLVFPRETLFLDTGACVLMYTDGIPETCSSQGEFFGHDRLENWLGTAANRALTAQELDAPDQLARVEAGLPPEVEHAQRLLRQPDGHGQGPAGQRDAVLCGEGSGGLVAGDELGEGAGGPVNALGVGGAAGRRAGRCLGA